MSRYLHLAAACVFAAVAAASLVGLATAAPRDGAESAQKVDCAKTLCIMAIF